MLEPQMVLSKLFAILRVRENVAGLEVTDTVLRFVSLDGGRAKTASVRLAPGIVEGGLLKDREKFVEAARELAYLVRSSGAESRIHVIVSVSSANIYSQVFSLPAVPDEELEHAVSLNIKMLSPGDVADSYAGWQVIEKDRDTGRYEFFASFINRGIVDALVGGLKDAGFFVHAVESRSLSLVRAISHFTSGLQSSESYLALMLDATGLEILVLRRGELYFEYFQSWRDIYGSERSISTAALEAVIVRSVHSVLNFYNTHWPELLSGVFISASGVGELVSQIIRNNFSLRPLPLTIALPSALGVNWVVAFGTALRGQLSHKEDIAMSLLGLTAQDEFRRHQIIDFLRFWRVLIPIALSVLLIALSVTDASLARIRYALEQEPLYALHGDQAKEVADLTAQVNTFNRSVALLTKVERSSADKGAVLDALVRLMGTFGLTLTKFSIQEPQLAASLAGRAPSEDQILQFKKALDGDQRFKGVNLPFSEIKPDGGSKSFVINFSIAPVTAK